MKLWNTILTLGFVILFFFVLVLGARVVNMQPDNSLGDEAMRMQEVYRLYIGLNNVNSNNEVIAIKDARTLIDDICLKHGCGFTSFVARGGWIDNDKNVIQERTLEYMISYASEEKITAILNEVMDALGQTAVLVERQLSLQTFYYNKHETKYPGK